LRNYVGLTAFGETYVVTISENSELTGLIWNFYNPSFRFVVCTLVSPTGLVRLQMLNNNYYFLHTLMPHVWFEPKNQTETKKTEQNSQQIKKNGFNLNINKKNVYIITFRKCNTDPKLVQETFVYLYNQNQDQTYLKQNYKKNIP